jgi:plasmid stability protein
MEVRDITLSLPADLLQQAEVYAAEHDTTVDALLRDILQAAFTRDGRALASADRLLAIARRGPHFTIDPGSISREEMHERS